MGFHLRNLFATLGVGSRTEPAARLTDRGGGVGDIRLVRVHDDEASVGGRRFLVDRVWPRGVRRHDLRLDGWLRDVAPSAELRRWFGHDPARWAEFRQRYLAELEAAPDAWRPLLDAARDGDVVLLYGARDPEHNNAVVLRELLLSRR